MLIVFSVLVILVAGGYMAMKLGVFNEKIHKEHHVPAESDEILMAKEQLEKMTTEEKIGQMLFSRVPESDIVSEIQKYHLGGYILFGRDVNGESIESLTTKIQTWQDASKIPLFIGIDEEGGTVSRLSYAGLADFRSPQEVYSASGLKGIQEDTYRKAELLAKIGVNVNFAPVADTCENPDSFIYDRSFGKDASATAEFVKTSVEAYKNSGVMPTLKHFPGYGENLDTHTGVAIDDRMLMSLREKDFLPFSAGIKAGAEMIMVSHNIMTSIDSNNPASLSPEIHKILRDELEFDGIILTDDLAMDAVSEYYQGEYTPEVQAVLAGNTMLIISDYARGFDNILSAVKSGVIPEEQINKAVLKILTLKHKNIVTEKE